MEGTQAAQRIRGRFAPSPSGRMHLGNLFAALLAWLSVRSAGGTLVLRMEDLDLARCPSACLPQLAEDLLWLGLDWDEGYGCGGSQGPYLQSQRGEYYAQAFRQLQGQVYPCYCTRAERLAASAPHRGDGQVVYSGQCRTMTPQQRAALEQAGRRPAWRLEVPDREVGFVDGHLGPVRQNLKEACGDFILRRSDGVYAYQLAVVVDDGHMAVNQVVRGSDLLASTPRQCYLYELLGLPVPQFYHVPLLLAPDGRRLSKREGDLDMGALRKRLCPEALVGRLAYLAGLIAQPTPIRARDLVDSFDWEKVPKSDCTVPALWLAGQ